MTSYRLTQCFIKALSINLPSRKNDIKPSKNGTIKLTAEYD